MIGVVGGYGAVGRVVAGMLAAAGAGPIRVGGRDEQAARAVADTLAADAVGWAVDVSRPASLGEFIRGCDVVVNCAGPSHLFSGTVVAAAGAAGADCVDAGGASRPQLPVPGRVAVSFAGALPGLSGVLPRWLAIREFDAVRELTVYTAVRDRFTHAGAQDYLEGVLGAETRPGAMWDGGQVVAAPRGRARTRLPYLGAVTAVPYLDHESRGVAAALGLERGRWHSAFASDRIPDALARARRRDRRVAVDDICRASALDAAGRLPYVLLLLEGRGRHTGRARERTAVLRAGGIAPLSGAVTAAAVQQVMSGAVAPGAHRAADVLDPAATIDALRESPVPVDVTTLDATLDGLAAVEEGAL